MLSVLLAAALIPSFQLQTPEGSARRFHANQAKATVVVFVSTVCPVANDYSGRLQRLRDESFRQGVALVLVYSNKTETASEISAHARAEFGFAVFRDPDNTVADLFGAQVTPTAFVLDPSGRIRYSGRIDDATNPARVTRHYLRDAVHAVLWGHTVDPAATQAYG
jgi:peroxiredoxin